MVLPGLGFVFDGDDMEAEIARIAEIEAAEAEQRKEIGSSVDLFFKFKNFRSQGIFLKKLFEFHRSHQYSINHQFYFL